ncbi:T9SS type A sorting domain-containing protein [candidate division WOR-3 bacterium]|nr:T9SS type A sorting domain-containing protein [candidate division WOR-3 bacterium]
MFILKRKINVFILFIALSLLGGGAEPDRPTLLRIFDNAILNPYPDYVCTLSVISNDPEGDSIKYEIQWDIDINFLNASSETIGPFASGEVALTTIHTVEETLYYWKARATDSISLGNWSSWSEIYSFTIDIETNDVYWYQVSGNQFAKCEKRNVKVEGDSIVIPKADTFLVVGFEGIFPPTGWRVQVHGTPSRKWKNISDLVHSGDSATWVRFHPSQEVHTWLITKALNLSNYATCTLSFWGQDTRASCYEYHGVLVSTTSQMDTSSFSEIQQITATAEGTWEQSLIDVSAYAGQSTVYFAWRYKEMSGTNWFLDDIEIFGHGSKGTLTSPVVTYSDLLNENPYRSHWDGVKWTKSQIDDSIGVQIEYKSLGSWDLVPDFDLPGNSNGFFDQATDFCTVDLSTLNTSTYDSLRIKAIFRRLNEKASSDPTLLMWGLGNTQDSITGISEDENPYKCALIKIEPNPFTNITEIRYQLPKRTNVSIQIFDIIGREVITLIKGIKEPGYYSLYWRGIDKNGNKLPSGVYFLRMKADDYKNTQKMLLVR